MKHLTFHLFIHPWIIKPVLLLIYIQIFTGSSQKDLVQPDEAHLDGVPFFIQHPKPLYYTMKGHPATVECVAEPVSHAVIECAEKVIPYKGPEDSGRLQVTRLDSENRVDPNGKRWRLTLQVRAKEVEEWFDSYVCRCEAWNKVLELQRPKKVVSKEAVIVEAYLDRKFQLEPVSTELEVGNRLVLTCIPPKGKPEPEVYWMKDGKRVTKDAFPHIIINDYNHLLIENATVSDSGNYSCVAECIGIEYRYATAKVNIHDPVPKKVHNPRLDSRTLHDTTELQKLIRTHEVAIYVCLLLFLAFVLVVVALVANRRRKLQRMTNSGYCFTSCLGGHDSIPLEKNALVSKDPLLMNDFKQSTTTIKIPSGFEANHTFYEGLSTSHLTQNGENLPGHYNPVKENQQPQPCPVIQAFPLVPAATYFGPSGTTEFPMNSYSPAPISLARIGAMNPPTDAMSSSLPYFVSNIHTTGTVSQNEIGTCAQQNVNSTEGDILISRATYPTLMFPDLSEGQSSANTTTNTTAVGSGNAGSSNCSPVVHSNTNANPRNPYTSKEEVETDFDSGTNESRSVESSSAYQYSSPNLALRAELQELCYVTTKTLSEQGGLLQIPNTGTSLYVPHGSIPPNTEEKIYLGLCRDDGQRPCLTDSQTLLSPIVQFGPANVSLTKAVILSIPHCAATDRGQAVIRLMTWDTNFKNERKPHMYDDDKDEYKEATCFSYDLSLDRKRGDENSHDDNNWKELITIVIQSDNVTTFKSDPGILMHFNSSVALLITQTPQRYCLVGESLRPNLLKQLGVLPHFSENGYTNSQYQPLMKLLRLVAFSGRLSPNMDLNVRVYVLPDTTDALARVVHLEQLLDGHLLGVSNSFSFQDNGANLCFVVNSLSEGWRSRLQVNTQEIPFRHIWSGTQVSTLHCAFTFEHVDVIQTSISCKIIVFQVTNWNQCETLHISYDATNPPGIYLPFENAHPTLNIERDTKIRRLSSETKSKLSGILDHSGEWQLLAGELGFEGMVPQMVSRTTPTVDLLDLWEAINPTEDGINHMRHVFNKLHRTDCVALLNSDSLTA